MKNKLMSILLMLVFFLSNAGCNNGQPHFQKYTSPVKIPDADFVYETIISGKEVLGFYSFATGKTELVDFGEFIHPTHPYYIDANTLMYKNKYDYFGSIYSSHWGLILSKGDQYSECNNEKIMGAVYSRNGQIILSNSSGIFLISPDDCSIEKTVSSEQDLALLGNSYSLSPYAYSEKGNFILYSNFDNEYHLNKYSIKEKKIIDLGVAGLFPVLSQDEKEIAYCSYDGIHIMDTEGKNDELVVTQYGMIDYINDGYFLPLPMWSMDGKKLLYHKWVGKLSFSEISDYAIFVYDLDTNTETLLVKGGMYPTWNYYK